MIIETITIYDITSSYSPPPPTHIGEVLQARAGTRVDPTTITRILPKQY